MTAKPPVDSGSFPRLQLIGTTQLLLPGRPAPLRLDKTAAALFALLVLDGERQREELVARLWPDTGAADPAGNLRQLRRKLRDKLGRECLQGTDSLALDDDVIHDLGPLLQSGSAPVGPDGPAAGHELPGGELLGGHDYRKADSLHLWVESQRERWRATRRRVWDGQVRRLEDADHLDAAIELAERMLLHDLHAEHAYLRVARLHWQRGDRDAARAVIKRCRTMLARDEVFVLGPRLAELAALIDRFGTQPTATALPATPAPL